MDYGKASIDLHGKLHGKIEVRPKHAVKTRDDLSIVYTPGVGAMSLLLAKQPELARTHSIKGNTVAVVSDGSAVLGLGNIGPLGALPVMEGKALLFKEFADIDAWPICLDTQDPAEIIKTVKYIAPVFGGINLEDIAAPKCFEIEAALQDLGIPVMHDDQHGTAIVLLAALMNASKVVGKPLSSLRIVINGAGAAGIAIANLMSCHNASSECTPVKDVILCDTKGIIEQGRKDLNDTKKEIASRTNREKKKGTLADALKDADVFIGVSAAGALKPEWVKLMAQKAIVLAMANPVPEIMPDEAKKAGAMVVGTGRSDFPNQVNNALAFPGVFRGALDSHAPRITMEMKIAAARALADYVSKPTADNIMPSVLDKNVTKKVAEAVGKAARNT